MGQGSGTSFGGFGSVDTGIPEPYGVDPSIAPGLPRMEGWRVVLPDGSAAWDKTGPLDTNWTLVAPGAGGDVTDVIAGNGILVTNPSGPQPIVAANYGASATAVAAASAAGAANTLSRSDHAHAGVRSVVQGTGITVDNTDPANPIVAASGGGDVTGLVAGDAGIVLTNAGGPVVTVGQIVAAEWPIANFRIYAVDFVNGLDTNVGFADAAGTSAADYAAACAAAGLVAVKTFAGLAAIFPRIGNGRLVEIVIANGGVNTVQAYAGGLETFLKGADDWGRACPIVRTTGTNTTAGAVAFAGTNADFDFQGAITATGCNAAGYNPTGAPTTLSVQCLKVGGGAAAIPVEPAAPLGWRMRFDNATTTAALRNVCRQVAQVSGTDTLIPQTAWPAVPVAGDVFYLEMGGVTVDDTTLGGNGIGPSFANSALQISGIRVTGGAGNIGIQDTRVRLAFCGCQTISSAGATTLFTAQSILHPILGTRTIGGGLRCEGSPLVNMSYGLMQLVGMVSVSAFEILFGTQIVFGAGSYVGGGGLLATAMSLPVGTNADFGPQFGITATLARPRTARMRIRGTTTELAGLTIEGAGANPAIALTGRCHVAFAQAVTAGSTGNNDVGLDLTAARGSLIILASTPTVTGALGDVRLAGGQIVTWAQAIATGITDSAGNRIIGTAGVPPQGMATKSGVLLSSLVGAQFTYIADENPTSLGALAVINNIVPVRWATSFRLATRLRACYLQPDPATKDIVVTLYKNNVATAMTVTITNGSAVGTKFVDLAHPILFLDGDDWAIRMDVGQAGAEGATAYAVGVTLEWAA